VRYAGLRANSSSSAAGLAVEARAAGATITPGSIRQIDATTTQITYIYTYPDRTREEAQILVACYPDPGG